MLLVLVVLLVVGLQLTGKLLALVGQAAVAGVAGGAGVLARHEVVIQVATLRHSLCVCVCMCVVREGGHRTGERTGRQFYLAAQTLRDRWWRREQLAPDRW